MLYNKNSVRKTNDKKILHKVGKQWKVVSVALLMAIGGGAAVAATNNTSANADVNANGQYTMDAQTSATVNSLEQYPGQGQSSAPASSASSKAPSASAKAPTMPSLSLNPDPSLNGYNASAELSRVRQAYDKEVIKYYGSKVNSYKSGVNAKLSNSAHTVNSNYDKATSTQSNDQSLASSFSAVANDKNWAAEVSNIASAKSGVGASEYIETVGANVSANSANLSSIANDMSSGSAIASYATLISEINSNVDLQILYGAKSTEASADVSLANNGYNSAVVEARNVFDQSVANQKASVAAYANNASNEAANHIASENSSADTSLVASMAGSSYGPRYSAMSSAVSVAALAFGRAFSDAMNPNVHTYNANDFNNISGLDADDNATLSGAVKAAFNDVNGLSAATSEENAYQSASAKNSSVVSTVNSLSDDVSAGYVPYDEAYYVGGVLANATNYNNSASTIVSVAASGVAQDVNNQGGSLASDTAKSEISNYLGSLFGSFSSGTQYNSKQANIVYNDFDAKSASYDNANSALSSYDTKYSAFSVSASLDQQSTAASTAVSNADATLSAASGAGNLYTLLSDTAVQQNYGNNRTNDLKVLNSTKAATSSLAAKVSEANNNEVSAKNNYASVSNSASVVAILGNKGLALSDVAKLVPSAGFYGVGTKDFSNVASALDGVPANGASEASVVSEVNSAANTLGTSYTNASNSSVAYEKSMDADFVLASSYAVHYEGLSSADQSAVSSASSARTNFYDEYAGNDFGSAEDSLVSAESDEPNAAGLANGYGQYVKAHEPHVVTVTKKLVLHSNPNYNDKIDTPADHKLAVVPVGTHLKVTAVGFDKQGNTRLYVNYKGQNGFVTGLRTYVTNSYLVAGERYQVTFNHNVREYNSLQFNKQSYVGTIKKGTTVTGTARLNDDGYHWLGLTRLQLDHSGDFVTTLDSLRGNTVELNGQSNNSPKQGTYFFNGEDTANPTNI